MTIDTVLSALEERFVKERTGFGHISRQQIVEKHSSPYTNVVLGLHHESLPIVMDGTYLYVQVGFAIYKVLLIVKVKY
jgi:hypothetical protein